MWQMALSLLLALSVYQSDIKDANQAREAKNTITKQETKNEKSEVKKVNIKSKSKQTKQEKVERQDANTYEWATFTVTAYDNGYSSTGKRPGDKGYGITKSGEKTVEGRTVSADPRVLPLGTVIYIENVGERVVTDTGGAIKGRRLDLYFESHKSAMQFGKQKLKVKIIKMGVKK